MVNKVEFTLVYIMEMGHVSNKVIECRPIPTVFFELVTFCNINV